MFAFTVPVVVCFAQGQRWRTQADHTDCVIISTFQLSAFCIVDAGERTAFAKHSLHLKHKR